MKSSYDIVIIGSGIAGSLCALVLQKSGLSCLVIEKGEHPRFAIGESTTPLTTLGLDWLARDYGIPELRQVAHYWGLKEAGCTAWPKQHFWFGNHRQGVALLPNEELMLETFQLPLGPDIHMLRSDADAWLVSRLPHHGIDYSDHTSLVDFTADPDHATVSLEVSGASTEVRCKLVVDASGHSSFFGRQFGLRNDDPGLHTNTRTLFGHFTGVHRLEDQLGHNPDFRFSRDGGTQHHCFDGGWIWVIPFDNGVTSVGFLLDRAKYPLDPTISVEDEIAALLARFPTVAAQLGDMRPTRPIVRTDRIQFTSSGITGDRFVLTPHAAGFIEPLFSTGITLTESFIARFAPLAAKACAATGPMDMSIFAPLEQRFLDEVAHVDRIIAGNIATMGHHQCYRQFWRTWTYGMMVDYGGRMSGRQEIALGSCGLLGSSSSRFRDRVKRMWELVDGAELTDHLAEELKTVMDEDGHPHRYANYEIGSEQACNLAILDVPFYFKWYTSTLLRDPDIKPYASPLRLFRWWFHMWTGFVDVWWRSRQSRKNHGAYHTAVDTIRALRTPHFEELTPPSPLADPASRPRALAART